MIEAVGVTYWPTYFAKLSASLKSRGQALIQSITIREDRFEDYSRNPDFINTMIFPGGKLLTNTAVRENAKAVGIASAKAFEFGLCYAETLRRWKVNFLEAHRNGNLPGLDDRFVNLWRFYLAYCEGAFSAGRINVAHFHLEKTS
jgi:cyclopropane-fatty-acyl-phospholipid synthase